MGLLNNIKTSISNLEDSIYISDIPDDSPNITCCIYRILGRPPDLKLDGVNFRRPSIRIVVRDISYANAELRMESIMALIVSLNNYGTLPTILQMTIESDIVSLGKDNLNRTNLYCNFSIKHSDT